MLKNAFFLFVGTIFVFAVFLPSYTELQDLKQKNREYDLQIQELKKQNEDLVEEKRRLEEDPEYLEKVAREKMGLIKEGEVIYKILPANQEAPRE
ncbi:MAG TPA: septum formation initiator family protein [Candidatus Omnitrophota bacterium]|nr:septum formation initiator family protein [Candidatus Omnitrophota bacterium]HQO57677.1 septum formation initiator family protein [Candidatus Omnitrophota bacterium]HQP12699.1 septum formation initiator family protein [Candidatus Omnitrophota bacterium]